MSEIKKPEVNKKQYTVLKSLTLDKTYFPSQKIYLADDKVTKKLLTNKFIK